MRLQGLAQANPCSNPTFTKTKKRVQLPLSKGGLESEIKGGIYMSFRQKLTEKLASDYQSEILVGQGMEAVVQFLD